MTKELCNILKNQLNNIAFLDVVAGITQPVIDVRFKEKENTAIAVKMPVSYDTSLGPSTFMGSERQLVPDKSRKSILYFEDFGSSPDPQARAGSLGFITNVRLVCWMNKTAIGFTKYEDVTTRCITEILERLVLGTGINENGFVKLFVYNPRILIQNASIFSPYNYPEAVVQYLRPPFEYFAIDLTCRYEVRRYPCLSTTRTSNQYIPVRIPILIKDSPTNVKQELDNGWFVRLEYPSGTTLTLSFLKGYNVLTPFVLNGNIVDGIVDDPIPYDEATQTWNLAGHPLAAFNDGDEIFINAALPQKL